MPAYIPPVAFNRVKIALTYQTILGQITSTTLSQECFTSQDWEQTPYYQYSRVLQGKHRDGKSKFYYSDDGYPTPLKWTDSDEGVIDWLRSEVDLLAQNWVKSGWRITEAEPSPVPPIPTDGEDYIIHLQLANADQITVPIVPSDYQSHLQQIATENYDIIYKTEVSHIQYARNVGVRHESVWDDTKLITEAVYLMTDANNDKTVTIYNQIALVRTHLGNESYFLYAYLVEDSIGIGDTLLPQLPRPDDPSAYYLYDWAQKLRQRVESSIWTFYEKIFTETTNAKGHTVKRMTYHYKKNADST